MIAGGDALLMRSWIACRTPSTAAELPHAASRMVASGAAALDHSASRVASTSSPLLLTPGSVHGAPPAGGGGWIVDNVPARKPLRPKMRRKLTQSLSL